MITLISILVGIIGAMMTTSDDDGIGSIGVVFIVCAVVGLVYGLFPIFKILN